MGKANRERRRMKEKARKQQRAAAAGSSGAFGSLFEDLASAYSGDIGSPASAAHRTAPPVAEQVAALIGSAVQAHCHGDDAGAARSARLLARDDAAWRREAERVLGQSLRHAVTTAWRGGWQPADLLRLVGRELKGAHLRLTRAVIAEEMATYAPATVDRRWAAQLADAEVTVWWPRELTALRAWAAQEDADWGEQVAIALRLAHDLTCLSELQVLMPIPGTAVPAARGSVAPEVDDRILARVRALLAKAESTTFPAEAETFTAGAQALMARHSIDQAMLAASGRAPDDEPLGRRIGIDNPYEAPKASLLDAVASANHCRAVWSKALGFSTVVGHPANLDTVEVLFTSLLVQATAAMTREGGRTYAGGGSRTRSFRQAFLVSYAYRIRERLTETTRAEEATAAAEPGRANLLPVLASRDEAVERAVEAMFPEITYRTTAASALDREGWASGRAAADLASLGSAQDAVTR